MNSKNSSIHSQRTPSLSVIFTRPGRNLKKFQSKFLEFDINFDTHDFCPKNQDEKRGAFLEDPDVNFDFGICIAKI